MAQERTGRARETRVSFARPVLSCANYFQAPATLATSKKAHLTKTAGKKIKVRRPRNLEASPYSRLINVRCVKEVIRMRVLAY